MNKCVQCGSCLPWEPRRRLHRRSPRSKASMPIATGGSVMSNIIYTRWGNRFEALDRNDDNAITMADFADVSRNAALSAQAGDYCRQQT